MSAPGTIRSGAEAVVYAVHMDAPTKRIHGAYWTDACGWVPVAWHLNGHHRPGKIGPLDLFTLGQFTDTPPPPTNPTRPSAA